MISLEYINFPIGDEQLEIKPLLKCIYFSQANIIPPQTHIYIFTCEEERNK
jgi:hypothetical protein